MNDLESFFRNNHENLIHKWDHYFDIYDRHFSPLRGKDIVVLEIGIAQGGSLKMWKQYFGPQARIIGVDIDERCKQFEEQQIDIFIGSQADVNFLTQLKRDIPRVDILIDDGGHTMQQQILTFENMFSHVKDGGIYLCEDLHTSYWDSFGGGYKKEGTFIEYSKNFIDFLHAWHVNDDRILAVNELTKTIASLHYYDSILVIEKRERHAPTHSMTGNVIFK